MPWKIRKGRRFYYRSVRAGDRVRSEYVGAGPGAELVATMDEMDRLAREAGAEALQAERAALDDEDREQAGRFDWIESVARQAIESAGYHRHNRGPWRRRRMTGSIATIPDPIGETPASRAEIADVLKRVQNGDTTAGARLREMIAADPGRMLEVSGGNLAGQVERAMVARMAQWNPIWAETLPPKLDALRLDLGGADPSPIERLLVERVVACWLDLHALEVRAASPGEMTIPQAEHRDKMRDRSHRRYLGALKSLAVVRKLGVVLVLANVDARTVNVDQRSADPSAGESVTIS